jgi:hypothetical protein
VTNRTADTVELHVDATAPATIVLQQSCQSQWVATVDGHPTTIRPANVSVTGSEQARRKPLGELSVRAGQRHGWVGDEWRMRAWVAFAGRFRNAIALAIQVTPVG